MLIPAEESPGKVSGEVLGLWNQSQNDGYRPLAWVPLFVVPRTETPHFFLTCGSGISSSLCKSSMSDTTLSLLSGQCSLTQVSISVGRMVRNCSSTSSSRICSLERIFGFSHWQQSSQSLLKASWGPAASVYWNCRKRWRKTSQSVSYSCRTEPWFKEAWIAQPRATAITSSRVLQFIWGLRLRVQVFPLWNNLGEPPTAEDRKP